MTKILGRGVNGQQMFLFCSLGVKSSLSGRSAKFPEAAAPKIGRQADLPEGGRFLPKPYSPIQVSGLLREMTQRAS